MSIIPAEDLLAQVSTPTAIDQAYVPTSTPEELAEPPVLNDSQKSNLFAIMLCRYFGVKTFAEIVEKTGTDMEVYDLIADAAKLRKSLSSQPQEAAANLCTDMSEYAAMVMAENSGDPMYTEYLKLEADESKLRKDILNKYSDDARSALDDVLKTRRQRAMHMNGPTAVLINRALEDLTFQSRKHNLPDHPVVIDEGEDTSK